MSTGSSLPRGPVHQILILDDGVPLPDAPTPIAGMSHPAFSGYRLWTRSSLQEFIDREFGPRVRAAFDRVRPYAYKADIARYCLLYSLGGWYADYSLRHVSPPDALPPVDLIAFRDRQQHSLTSWAVQCGLLYSRPGLAVMRDAIDMCVAHIEQGYYGATPLAPTGPAVLGRAVALHGQDVRALLGDFLALTPLHERPNLAYVGPDGWIWAHYKTSLPGDVGVKGGNAYNLMWHSGIVYSGEPAADRPGAFLGAAYPRLDPKSAPRIRSLVLGALKDRVPRGRR